MNRIQFMEMLERLLKDLPENERQEAVQYYNDYFDDAGPENEAQVIGELGSPAQVARTIRDGMSENGEYTERGYEDARFRDSQELSSDCCEETLAGTSQKKKEHNPWKLLSILLLCLLLLPVIVPLCMIPLIIVAAVLIGIVGMFIGIGVAAVVLPFTGIIMIGSGFYNLFFSPGIGVTLGGVGCLLLSFGILVFLLAIWVFKTLIPLCIRCIVALIRYPLRKAGVVK